MTGARSSDPEQAPGLLALIDQARTEIREAAFDAVPEGSPPDTERAKRERVLELELEQLPYNLMSAHEAVLRLEGRLTQITSESFADIPNLPDISSMTMVLLPHDVLPIAWAVDSFLDSGRRAQNALTRYVARAFKVSIPQSLNDYASASRRHAGKIPDRIRSILLDYWDTKGLTLKRYRDLAQHHTVVSSNVVLKPGSPSRVQVHLPSNPEETSLMKLHYGPPHVHVFTYCRGELAALVTVSYKLMYAILRYLGVSAKVSRSLIRPYAIPVGAPEAFSVLPEEDIETALNGTMRRAFLESVAAHGGLADARLPSPR